MAAPHEVSARMVLGLVMVSGALGLSYEVLWARILALAAGHTLGAMSTVAATFMGGLALGSVLAERPRAREIRPLVGYGALEIGIAVYAVLLPLLLPAIDPVADLAYRWSGARPAFALALQLAWAALLLLVPTTLMGATTPLLVRARIGGDGASRLAWIYAANSLGGAAGALVVTFGLLPALGHRATGWTLALCGIALGTLAIRWGSRDGFPIATESGGRSVEAVDAEAKAVSISRTGLAIGGLSGAVGMALEVAWTRALILFLGSSTYAFSMILSTFIFGLATGSHVAGWLLARSSAQRGPCRRRTAGDASLPQVIDGGTESAGGLARGVNARRAVGVLLIALGASGLGSLALMGHIPAWSSDLLATASDSFALVCLAQLVMVGAITLPATLALGMILPLCARLEGDGGEIGHLYGTNTAGAVVGSLSATFAGIPLAGMAGTIACAALAPLAVGGWVAGGSRRVALAAGCAALGLAALQAIPPWDQAVLDSGPFVVARQLMPGMNPDYVQQAHEMGRILFHREGPCVTVAVRESGHRLRTLVVNGKPDASTLLDMKTQRLVAHLPLAMHENPQDVLVIGLGSGVTAGSVLKHPVKTSTVVELSPEVVEASKYFNPESGAPLEDPRTTLILTDGRTHVFRTDRSYDVIVSEPTNPWISGVSSLFTREYFAKCRSRLRSGGIMSQWLQGYSLPPEDVMSIVRTFRTVFPEATLWKSVTGADYILIGTTDGKPASYENLARSFGYQGVRRECADVEVRDEVDLLAHFMAGPKALDTFDAGARVQVDDRLDLEFSAPRHVGLGCSEMVLAVLKHLVEPPQALIPRLTAAQLTAVDLRRKRYDAYELLREGNLKDAVGILSDIEHTCAEERIPASFLKGFYLAATNLMSEQNALDKAYEVLQRLVERFPADDEYAAALGTAMARKGEIKEARTEFETILARRPDEPNGHRGLAVLDEAAGNLRGALAHYRAILKTNPSDPLSAGSVVRLLRALEQPREADEALRTALATDPGLEGAAIINPLPEGLKLE